MRYDQRGGGLFFFSFFFLCLLPHHTESVRTVSTPRAPDPQEPFGSSRRSCLQTDTGHNHRIASTNTHLSKTGEKRKKYQFKEHNAWGDARRKRQESKARAKNKNLFTVKDDRVRKVTSETVVMEGSVGNEGGKVWVDGGPVREVEEHDVPVIKEIGRWRKRPGRNKRGNVREPWI